MGALCCNPHGDSGGGAELIGALRRTAARLAFDLVVTQVGADGALDVTGDRPLSAASRQSIATLVLSYLQPPGCYTYQHLGDALRFQRTT